MTAVLECCLIVVGRVGVVALFLHQHLILLKPQQRLSGMHVKEPQSHLVNF